MKLLQTGAIMENSEFEQFRRQLLEAQKTANKNNCGVQVPFNGKSTFVEPNLPRFTKKEIEKRFTLLTEEEDSELLPDSVSILARPERNKLSTRYKGINLYFYIINLY